MDVATRLFAERGYDATTTSAIAAAAGVSEPVLYRHFKGKQELFQHIVCQVTRTTQEYWSKLMSGVDDPAEAFRIISTEWPSHMRTCAAEYGVIHNALVTSRDEQVIAALRAHYQQLETFFISIIRLGQDKGVYRRDLDLKTAAWWIMNSGVGFTLIGLTLGTPPDYSVQHGIELTLRAIIALD
jgi:TetR/AcrR family transcriptional regulator